MSSSSMAYVDRLQRDVLTSMGLRALATAAVVSSPSKLILVTEATSEESLLLQEWTSSTPFRQRSSFKLREVLSLEKVSDANIVQVTFNSNKMINLVLDNESGRLIKLVVDRCKENSKVNEHEDNEKCNLKLINMSSDSLLNDEFDVGVHDDNLGSKELQDLQQLISACDYAVSEADRFAEDISRDLRLLDGANVHSILASETSVASLMSLLERAEEHALAIDNRLNSYDQMLEHVRVSLGGSSNAIEVVNANNAKLFECLQSTVEQLQLGQQEANLLSEADAVVSERGGRKLNELASAAERLKAILQAENRDERLLTLKAVQDQLKMAEKLKDRLAKALSRHLNNLLVHMANSSDSNMALSMGSSVSVSQLSQRALGLSRRKPMHEELMHYARLVHWLKDMDGRAFGSLKMIYTQNLGKIYERDLKRFFELARVKVNNVGNSLSNELLGSSRSRSSTANLQQSNTMGLLGGEGDTLSLSSESSNSERERFDDTLELILVELGDVCMDEQFFAKSFFNLHSNNDDEGEEIKVKEETRQLMSQVFPSLEQELLAFITHFERVDAYFTLYALVRLGTHVLSTQHDTGSFLALVFGSVLVHTKRNLDRFMEKQRKSIEEYKAKNPNHILTFVSRLEPFFRTTENVLRGSDRRVEIDKWYVMIVSEVMRGIERVALSTTGSTGEVVRLENHHHLHGVLSQFKITSLDALRKEAKQKYVDALEKYVTRHFGRPLEQLTRFFEGVQQLLSAGVKESEVGYQMRYSKQELRKLVAAYPGREVKRGLEALYKKTRKQLSEEENLMPVVWRAMQEEFLKQYNNMQDLITKCYAGAQIQLDFTVDKLLRYFSEIAASN